MLNSYCHSLTKYTRRKTRVVNIGDIPVGGSNPIRVQSMTTSDTMDTEATVNQSIRMINAGCEYVRITAPSIKEAKHLAVIKKTLAEKGYKIPLIADIHFTPNAAEAAARIVEKVRINPGNFADRKKFQQIEYTDSEYQNEIDRIRLRFLPLVKICKEYGTAMRIGTNHGSLSDRILSRYGDTPLGMVESALEFLRICNDENYHDIILSMKSSNPIVMVQAYRLLVKKMNFEKMYYPLHLGVTEAGEGIDGRIKSSLGIGTLLEDGLGDTIRVSLTEEPEYEIPVAKYLVDRYKDRKYHNKIKSQNHFTFDPYHFERRYTESIINIGHDNVPRVVNYLRNQKNINIDMIQQLGYKYLLKEDKWGISDTACDYIDIGNNEINFKIPGTLGVIQSYSIWNRTKKERHYPCLTTADFLQTDILHLELNFLELNLLNLSKNIIEKINDFKNKIVLIIDTQNKHGMAEQREIFNILKINNLTCPVIIRRYYNNLKDNELQLEASTDIGGLFVDGLGDGLSIVSNNLDDISILNTTSFIILQASRMRVTKTEYISCPSCGRTLFDLQETTSRIRSRTQHLKGVKIGIMGCIVNGPGEMADADYGYVGTGVGKITLYKGQEVISKNLDTQIADEALIQLIKDNGDWVEP